MCVGVSLKLETLLPVFSLFLSLSLERARESAVQSREKSRKETGPLKE